MSVDPLVWVVLPTTRERVPYLARALANWRRQTYRNFRVLVLDTSGDHAAALRSNAGVLRAMPDDPRFLYAAVPPMPLGEKYNTGCSMAPDGALLAFSGDDDWNHPERLARTVAAMETARVTIAGSMAILAYRERDREAFLYRHPRVVELISESDDGTIESEHTTPYLVHGTMVLAKHHWERCQFPSRQRASDSVWTRELLALSAPDGEPVEMQAHLSESSCLVTVRRDGQELRFLQLDDPTSYVAWSHGSNTGNPLDSQPGAFFRPWAPGVAGLSELLGTESGAFNLQP